ncbi:MAG TPA: ATP-binding protein [Gaiellaceae bacterium]|nr:ATP-binding protein [Gaiellaceae bacterium]
MNRRLLLGYLGVTLFVLVALEVPLGIQNGRNERSTLAARIEQNATTIASLAEDAIQVPSSRALRAVAQSIAGYAKESGARVVVADREGAVRIDTSRASLGAENFRSRPEIAAALQGRVASGTRWSETLHTRLLYVAVPIASGGVVHGAVRITYETSAVDRRVLRFWLLLAGVGGIVLAGAAVVGLLTARFVSRPLRGLEHAAAAVGRGDLDARAPEAEGPAEVRSLAAVFNETATKLARLLRAQEEFVADASHELRTPLTALRLRLENDDVDGALREAERLSELVESLLALARADAAPAERVDVRRVALDRIALWRPLADEQGVRLAADVNGSLYARAAPGRLAQVVDNLVTNALAVSPAGATVTVAARGDAGGVELHVVDEGPGLTPEQRERAFDRFWRAGSGSGGSGLGLAIVRKLVEADAGSVRLREAPGGGVEAVVRLRPA